jgi:hypothetical protein
MYVRASDYDAKVKELQAVIDHLLEVHHCNCEPYFASDASDKQ